MSRAGVFVNESEDEVRRIAGRCRLDMLQFHGEESPEYCAKFAVSGYKVIKAFRIKDSKDLNKIADYEADYYLLDTFVEEKRGGSGKAFDWDLALEAKKMVSPIILSGGLNPDNIADAIERIRPFGVDVSSGVEKSPGIKDHNLLEDFIRNAKNSV